jgi:hypothetical protein
VGVEDRLGAPRLDDRDVKMGLGRRTSLPANKLRPLAREALSMPEAVIARRSGSWARTALKLPLVPSAHPRRSSRSPVSTSRVAMDAPGLEGLPMDGGEFMPDALRERVCSICMLACLTPELTRNGWWPKRPARRNIRVTGQGGHMPTTRREALFGIWMALSAALAFALPQEQGPLEVTYYYLPG